MITIFTQKSERISLSDCSNINRATKTITDFFFAFVPFQFTNFDRMI